ncbi:MAG: AAA-like domain-containing protein [Fimbriimonadaceae bacterium]|nr:AAA-like domain-containing protein [Fimbriimonadaceae bacterium]
MWQIRMLGRFEVVSSGTAASFRSRRVGALLAFLALNKGRPIANHTLQDLLWPDSDGDRQAQSLRRAIADLRDALEDEGERGKWVRTDHGKTMLAVEAVKSDVEEFESLLAAAQGDDDGAMADALVLYGGPLLAPLDDDWVFAYRRQYEEMYCRAVDELCRTLVGRGQGREAVRLAHAATLLAPLREEPYVASILGYASMGNHTMALQQYEALETMLADEYGQTPGAAAAAALDAPEWRVPGALDWEASAREGHPANQEGVEPEAAASGGAVPAGSRLYIERAADRRVEEAMGEQEAVVLVFGPRQTGKTSLVARAAGRARGAGHAVAVTDFQALSRSEIERSATLYRALVHSLATQLGLTYEPSWNEWIGPNSNLDALVESLLRQVEGPVCWAMDEVDRVFGTEYADDFFGLVRSWHNRRALDPDGPWKRLCLLISYATEAHLFIADLNQSPFNVGVRVSLRDFTESEVAELGARYGVGDPLHSAAVWKAACGHPYLSQRAFAFLARGGTTEELAAKVADDEGPFGEHLRHLWEAIRRDPETAAEVRRLLAREPLEHNSTRQRLWAAGVLASAGQEAGFRVPAYEAYLRRALC